MTDSPGEIRAVRVEDEMKVSYLDYAMSVARSGSAWSTTSGSRPRRRFT